MQFNSILFMLEDCRSETEVKLKYFSLKWEISAIFKQVKQHILKIQIIILFKINIFLQNIFYMGKSSFVKKKRKTAMPIFSSNFQVLHMIQKCMVRYKLYGSNITIQRIDSQYLPGDAMRKLQRRLTICLCTEIRDVQFFIFHQCFKTDFLYLLFCISSLHFSLKT